MEKFPDKIAGILKLSSPYKFKATNKKTEAFLFEPLNNKLPNFIVQSSIGKSSNEDQAVIIEYLNSDLELPRGNILQILGPISYEENIYKLHLYNKEIYPKTIKVNNENIKEISIKEEDINFPLEIYSIDPENCRDIDDAFSYELLENQLKLYIHISNVSSILEKLGILKTVITNTITSIYPPNSNVIHMLPNILSTNLLSLIEKTVRPLITLEISYDLSPETWSYKFYQSIGKITRNYSYEKYPKRFNELFLTISNLYQKITNNSLEITDSHKLIEAFMLIYNYLASKELSSINLGIFRCQEKNTWKNPIEIPYELSKFISYIHSNSAIYSYVNSEHSSLSLDNYCHITSPIRRVVDIYNQTILVSKLSVKLFIELLVDIEKVNSINKMLKRLYRDFESYSFALKLYNEELETNYNGYIYDLYENNISVYIPKLKLAINYRLFDYELDCIYEVNLTGTTISIFNKQKNIMEWTLELYKEYNMTIYGKPNYKKLNRSVLIDIHYE